MRNPTTEVEASARQDCRAAIAVRVGLLVACLLALAERFSLAGIGPFVTGHSYYVAGTNRPSNHTFGRAVDIGTVNGQLVSPASTAARQAALALGSLPAPVHPDEIGSRVAELSGQPSFFSDADHQDHIHLGFDQ